MPVSEFVMWTAYLDNEMNTPGRIEYYLAQITAELRRPFVKNASKPKLIDFLNPVKFIRKRPKSKTEEKAQIEASTNAAKSFFLRGVGLIGRGQKNV